VKTKDMSHVSGKLNPCLSSRQNIYNHNYILHFSKCNSR